MNSVPPVRIQKCNEGSINPKENYVLYWMVANRRIHMRKADRVFQTAYAFRRFFQKTLYSHLFEKPKRYPLKVKGSNLLLALTYYFLYSSNLVSEFLTF